MSYLAKKFLKQEAEIEEFLEGSRSVFVEKLSLDEALDALGFDSVSDIRNKIPPVFPEFSEQNPVPDVSIKRGKAGGCKVSDEGRDLIRDMRGLFAERDVGSVPGVEEVLEDLNLDDDLEVLGEGTNRVTFRTTPSSEIIVGGGGDCLLKVEFEFTRLEGATKTEIQCWRRIPERVIDRFVPIFDWGEDLDWNVVPAVEVVDDPAKGYALRSDLVEEGVIVKDVRGRVGGSNSNIGRWDGKIVAFDLANGCRMFDVPESLKTEFEDHIDDIIDQLINAPGVEVLDSEFDGDSVDKHLGVNIENGVGEFFHVKVVWEAGNLDLTLATSQMMRSDDIVDADRITDVSLDEVEFEVFKFVDEALANFV